MSLEYSRMRYRCLNTILKQIVKNPKDIYAINDFCFLATYDNITRYSEFMFGNSAPLEHMMLFPEILEDDDENNEGDEFRWKKRHLLVVLMASTRRSNGTWKGVGT